MNTEAVFSNNYESVLCELEEYSNISPKQIEIYECKAQVACILNELWHSTLPKIHWSNVVRNTYYVCYVFMYKGSIIGVAIWSSPTAQNRYKQEDKDTILELRRLALSDMFPKNGATRVISIMTKKIKQKFPKVKRLISYQETESHHGTIYKASNWTPVKKIKTYSWNKGGERSRADVQTTSDKVRWEYFL